MLGRFFNKTAGDAIKAFRTKLGDTAFLNAAASFAANVTAADGSIDDAEIKKAKKVMIEHPIIAAAFTGAEIEKALDAALDRAETRGGRSQNAEYIQAMQNRDEAERKAIFLIGADVGDVGDIGDKEMAALVKGGELLGVNAKALLDG
jgi:tellurite resistance protein